MGKIKADNDGHIYTIPQFAQKMVPWIRQLVMVAKLSGFKTCPQMGELSRN